MKALLITLSILFLLGGLATLSIYNGSADTIVTKFNNKTCKYETFIVSKQKNSFNKTYTKIN